MKGCMDISEACECGTTLRMSTLDEDERREYQEKFAEEHKYHQRVSHREARKLREAENGRRNKSGRKISV